MFVEKLSVSDDEKIIKKGAASMHYSDSMGVPKISEGYLILTNRRLVFAGRSALKKAATQVFKLVVGVTANLPGGESPFVEQFKGAIEFPFDGIVEVGKGGRTIRSVGMQTLKVGYEGTGEFRFQLPALGGKVEDWIKSIKTAMESSSVEEKKVDMSSINLAEIFPKLPFNEWVDIREIVGYTAGVKKTLFLRRHEGGVDIKEAPVTSEQPKSGLKKCWLQGINGSFDIVEQGTTNLENAIKGVEQLAKTPVIQNPALCPFTLGFQDGTSSIEMYKVSDGKFFFRATYGKQELTGELETADIKDCINDYFDNRKLRCRNLLKES
jgi:hypothetical protein